LKIDSKEERDNQKLTIPKFFCSTSLQPSFLAAWCHSRTTISNRN